MATPTSGKWFTPSETELSAFLRNYAKTDNAAYVAAMRSLAEEEDAAEVKVSKPASITIPSVPSSSTALVKFAIPKHLLTFKSGSAAPMRAVSTKPVGNKGRGKKGRKEKGWRDVTAGDALNYGKKAWQLAKHLATLINVEDKKFDVDGSGGATITTTASVINLSNIAQGNDYNNRSGDSILGQGIEFRAWIRSNAAVSMNMCRILLLADRENHGVDPVIGDVLQAGTNPFLQPMLATAGNRFEILYDELVNLHSPSPGLASAGTSTDYVKDVLLLPTLIRKWNKHIKYTSTTGADASNWENALFLMAISDQAANGPGLFYTFRLHFTDN